MGGMVSYDIAIIGAGPGGYVAAIRAAQLGARVALIEKEEVGGVCLNRGCIPTKTIIASVNKLRAVKNSAAFGINISGEIAVDFFKIIERKNSVVQGLVKGIQQLIKANKIDLIKGHAHFKPDRSLFVDDTKIDAANIILATGSGWRRISGLEYDSKFVLTSDDILNLDKVPASICILGGGVIGCEFASILSALGSTVTIVEAMQNILPSEDEATSKYLLRCFKKQGITVLTGTTVEEVKKCDSSIEAVLSNGETIKVEKILVSIGRKPNIDGYGLEHLDLTIEKGSVSTDEKMRTNVKGVLAIGDINGRYMLAHKASEEGIVAVETIMGLDAVMEYHAIPRPVYTYPEICCIGMTEKELLASGTNYKIGKFSYGALSKALCDGLSEGQILLYSEAETGKILGAQLIGEHSTELGAEITLAIKNDLSVRAVIDTIHSHPTLSEITREAAEDCEGRSIHKVYRQQK